MTIQMRTPFRDADSGRMVHSKSKIIKSYLKSWFIIDFISVFPFELIGFGSTDSDDLGKLTLLRFFRLARLLKLLRILRANKKLQRLRVNSKMRYKTVQYLGVSCGLNRLKKQKSMVIHKKILYIVLGNYSIFNALACLWLSIGF